MLVLAFALALIGPEASPANPREPALDAPPQGTAAPHATAPPATVPAAAPQATAPDQAAGGSSSRSQNGARRDPLLVAGDLIAANELSAAVFILDDAIAAEPRRAELYRARADARQLRVERRRPLELIDGGGGSDPISGVALARAAEDLRSYARYEALASAEAAAVERRIQRLTIAAEALSGKDARARSAEELAAIRQRRFRLRTSGAVLAGAGVATAIAGFSLAGASTQFFPVDAQCVVACAVGGRINGGILSGGATAAVVGAGLAGVGLAMVTRNPRLIREDSARPRLAWERAVGRTNAMRTAGIGLFAAAGFAGVTGAVLAVSSARQFAAANLAESATADQIAAIGRTANAAASTLAIAPLLATLGGGLRAATAPPAPGLGVQVTVVGSGVTVAGRF